MENLAYLLQPTFDAWAAAPSHHELNLRRERKKGASTSGGGGEEKKRGLTGETGSAAAPIMSEVQKLLEESLVKHILEVKKEIAG